MKIVKKNVDTLKEAPYNPRISVRDNKPLYDKLKKSIETFGYVEPIVYNVRTGNVVGGNQRFQILKDLGIREIDAVEVDLNEDDEKALNLTLNKVAGSWDMLRLADVLASLKTMNYADIGVTGFDMDEINKILGEGKTDVNLEIGKLYEIIVECKDENEQEKNYNKLCQDGYTCRLLTL